MATKNTAKKTTPKKKVVIKETVKNGKTPVLETATEVLEEVVEKTTMWSAAFVKAAKTSVKDIDVAANLNQVKATVKNINSYTIETTSNLVDSSLANGLKWQGVAEKAVKGGLKLAERQQELVFDTLDTVKEQMIHSAARFKTLFSKN